VPNENFRNELGHVFEEMAGSPSAALPDRVRSSLAAVPENRGPYWIAGVAAALIAAVVIGVLVVGNPLNRPSSTVGPGLTQSPGAASSATPSPSPTGLATPSPSLPAFVCTSSALHIDSAQVPSQAVIDDLRAGTHPGYDRLTIQLRSGGLTDVELRTQAGANFTQGASGQAITLAGNNGILVVVHAADLHSGYSGPTDIKTGYGALLEIRQVEDFEGTVQLGLGVAGATCYRAFTLTSPTRLVIDVEAP
jgi:hypothetical protein